MYWLLRVVFPLCFLAFFAAYWKTVRKNNLASGVLVKPKVTPLLATLAFLVACVLAADVYLALYTR